MCTGAKLSQSKVELNKSTVTWLLRLSKLQLYISHAKALFALNNPGSLAISFFYEEAYYKEWITKASAEAAPTVTPGVRHELDFA